MSSFPNFVTSFFILCMIGSCTGLCITISHEEKERLVFKLKMMPNVQKVVRILYLMQTRNYHARVLKVQILVQKMFHFVALTSKLFVIYR